MTTMRERLETNLANAEARYARAEEKIRAAREAGVDTSKFEPPYATSPDFALARLEGQVDRARRDLDEYLAKTGEQR